jgi:hypothetical protein
VEIEAIPAATGKGGNSRGVRAAAWASTAAALGSGVACALFYGMGLNKAGDFSDARDAYNSLALEVETQGPTAELMTEEQRLRKEMESAGDDARKFQNLGLGFAIGAGIFAAAGVVLFIVGRNGEESPEATTAVSVAPSGLVVVF